MARLSFGGTTYSQEDGESVLATLLRHDVDIPHACEAGACHSCLMRRTDGPVPESSQPSLKPTVREQNHFLACQFLPQENITVALADDARDTDRAIVCAVEPFNRNICRILLEPARPLSYHAGQYINLRRADGLGRSYSLASLPRIDRYLEFHVRRIKNGTMSGWINDVLAVGDQLDFAGPYGECFYLLDNSHTDLLLIGTGTGVAPLDWHCARCTRKRTHGGHIPVPRQPRFI